MQYEYIAKSTAGETVTGLLEADSPNTASHQLREKDLFVLTVKPASRGRSTVVRGVKRNSRAKVSKRDLVTLTSQLAIMSRAGIDLASSLENVADQCPIPALKKILQAIHEDVLSGKSVSVALGNYEHVFGQSYIAGIAAAEATGRLPEVLDRLAQLLRAEQRMGATLRSLLAYPFLLASISSLVTFALVFFVLPQFAGVFEQLDLTLPIITRLLIGVSMELRVRFWLWGVLAIGTIVGVTAFAYSENGRKFRDHVLLNMVFVRDVTRAILFGRAFRLLGTMVDSGVPLLDGLRLTRSSMANSLMRDLFDKLEEEVVNGRRLSDAFMTSPFVPPAAAQMIATAEQTGTLGMVTQLMGEFYEEEGETRLRELATILEPLIIIVMGVVVAVVVMSVMLPIFDFATAAQ